MMLPVLALFDFLHEFGPDHFRTARDVAGGFGAHVETFHQVIRPAGDGIVERAVEGGRANERAQFFRRGEAAMEHGHGLEARAVEDSQARGEVEELRRVLVVEVELEEVVRQRAVVDGVLRVEPFAVEDEPAAEHRLQRGTFHGRPLLEEIVLRVHPLRNLVATALQHHAPARCEVDANVGAVDLLFHDERWVGDEHLGFLSAQVSVVVRALRAEEMRSAWVFDEVVAGGTHNSSFPRGGHFAPRFDEEVIRRFVVGAFGQFGLG